MSDGPLRYVSPFSLPFVDARKGCPETQAISSTWRGFHSRLRLSHFVLVSPRRTAGSWSRSSGGMRPSNTVQWLSARGSSVCFTVVSSLPSTISLSHSRLCAHLILPSSRLGNPCILARLTAPYLRLLKNLNMLCRAHVSPLCQARLGLVKMVYQKSASRSVRSFRSKPRYGGA